MAFSVTGWRVPASSVFASARAGYRACGALCLMSLCALSSQVQGDAAEASAFTWPKNDPNGQGAPPLPQTACVHITVLVVYGTEPQWTLTFFTVSLKRVHTLSFCQTCI